MTRKRYDDKSTEFGLWLRKQPKIDSTLGYTATDLDYIWCNYKTGEWMLIEEKRYQGQLSFSQEELFHKLKLLAENDSFYKGFHILRFERTNPDDGRMWLDGKLITSEELIAFLQFKKNKEY